MKVDFKFQSVAWKWIVNVFLVIFLIILTLEVAFCIFIRSYYVSSVKSAAEEYAQGFITPLSNCQPADYKTVAKSYCEAFKDKNKIEIQVLDETGKVLYSTSGFAANSDNMPDYDRALSTGEIGSWSGKNSVGENVLSQTALLKTAEGESFGAVRSVVSLSKTDEHVFVVCVMAIVIGVLLLSLTVVSGMYFITSIVKPIRDASNISRKIAMGDFNSRIEIRESNEVGELCDSINYMASELQQAENMKNDFISSVSHELRTPLTAIRGWAETAKFSIGEDEETVKKGLDVVIKESERLHGLVEELLDFSRMQSGKLSLNFDKFELLPVLSEAADMYRELAKKQNIELIYMPSGEEVFCYGDTNRIKQVFINVIDNALKYNQSGGQILIEERIADNHVQIIISDTGVGIAEKDLDRVKEKFYKANKQVRGSGIGLAVADEIIKQHNGLILIDSTEGVGTTVTIVLPLTVTPEGEENEL